MSNIIVAESLGKRVADALGLEHARRIIIDMEVGDAVKVYAEFYGDTRLLDIDWSGIQAQIIYADQEQAA